MVNPNASHLQIVSIPPLPKHEPNLRLLWGRFLPLQTHLRLPSRHPPARLQSLPMRKSLLMTKAQSMNFLLIHIHHHLITLRIQSQSPQRLCIRQKMYASSALISLRIYTMVLILL